MTIQSIFSSQNVLCAMTVALAEAGSVEKLARHLNVQRSTIHAWLADKKKPTTANIAKLLVLSKSLESPILPWKTGDEHAHT